MNDPTMDYCRRCGRMKGADGFPFCGGSYCLHDASCEERLEHDEREADDENN